MNSLRSALQTTKHSPPFRETTIVYFVTLCYITRCATPTARGLVESVGGDFGGTERCVFSTILLIDYEREMKVFALLCVSLYLALGMLRLLNLFSQSVF